MRINTNIMALDAYRNLNNTNDMLASSLEKLSSGYRINRAADDASGLVISQNLDKQISGLKVATQNAISAALVDAAIASVSALRGQLGADQNRFQSTIANLQVTVENLSASESRIRDTDMASEMVNFTKDQILLQAGTAMLAQANSAPQTILKLLQ